MKKLLALHKLKVAFGTGFVAFLITALALVIAAKRNQETLRKQAELESRNSEASRLLAEANYAITAHPQRGLLLLVEALKVHLDHGEQPLLAVQQGFLSGLTNISGFKLGTASGGMQCVGLSPDDRWVAAGGIEGQVVLWDLQSPHIRQSSAPPCRYRPPRPTGHLTNRATMPIAGDLGRSFHRR